VQSASCIYSWFFQVGAFVAAGICLIRYWRRLIPLPFPIVPLIFAVLWGVFQWLSGRTIYPFDTKLAVVRWTTFWAIFVTGYCFFQDLRVASWFRRAMLWFAFLVAIEAIIQTFTSPDRIFWIFPTQYKGVTGPILYHSHYAVFIETVFPFALFNALKRESERFLYAGMAAVMYASVVASESRGGTILVTAEILVVFAVLYAQGLIGATQAGKALAHMALLFAGLTLIVGWQSLWNRFMAPDLMAIRRQLDQSSFRMIADRPWIGFGLGTWPTAYPRYALVDIGLFVNQAHSDWLEWTAEGGLPFGAAMFSLFVWCLRPAFKSVWGIGVIAVLIHAGFDYPFSRPAVGSWVFVLISMLAANDEARK
jgi:O-antigen ligase